MGKTIQFESHKVELPGIEEYEEDTDVLEYYDQPYQFTLEWTSNSGQIVRASHIPDFFVIRNKSAGFEEWKPETRLEKLATKQPHRYTRTKDGRWHHLPACAYAEQLGLYYRNRKYQIIEPLLKGNKLQNKILPARTVRRWKTKFRAAQQKYNCGYIGLLDNHMAKGNRQPRILQESEEFINKIIEEQYETLKQKGKLAVYGILAKEWEKTGRTDKLPSYATFSSRIKQRSGYQQTKKRKGARAAYEQSPFYWELKLTTPRHGDRPFEIGHIDHTQLDIELVCSRTGRSLGRPWATVLIDAYSRRILAIYLTFDEPSYRSCMMLLRICVQRFSRLPETIVVDGGTEFGSTYFETLLAAFECTKKQRPAAKARFGSIIERLFGTTNTEFFQSLRGNTQITKNVRLVTKLNNPKRQAVWTLDELYEHFCAYSYEFYDCKENPALGQSPRQAFTNGLTLSGSRPQQQITYDENFKIFTLPFTPKGTAKEALLLQRLHDLARQDVCALIEGKPTFQSYQASLANLKPNDEEPDKNRDLGNVIQPLLINFNNIEAYKDEELW
jgi:transposase InsO family protein